MMHTGVVVLNLEKALTNSENIRGQLVEMNRILMVAVQQALDNLKESNITVTDIWVYRAYTILDTAEDEVKKIATKDEKNAGNY